MKDTFDDEDRLALVEYRINIACETMLGLHFISKGRISVSLSQIYSVLFYQWYSMDYDAFVYCDQKIFDELYPKAEAFIEEIKS